MASTAIPRRQLAAAAAVAAVALLGGCATQPDVRPLATGRGDVSAFELNGADVDTLRREAQRLCPLGGEILREAGHGLPLAPDAGRWRNTLNTLAAWAEPPRRPAQMVVLCREGGDRYKLQAAAPSAPVAPMAHPAAASPSEVTSALPVGPILPEW